LGKTILVVDDNREFLNLLNLMLTKAGYRVVLAEDGVQALEILEAGLPDAMILDLMMPVRNGFELLENIRWDPRFGQLPVIVLTAMSLNEEEREFIDEFSVACLDKVHTPDLIENLKKLIP
jgi:chemosensory pili system protein ChpA (sensor histidine kinase/response regulator)